MLVSLTLPDSQVNALVPYIDRLSEIFPDLHVSYADASGEYLPDREPKDTVYNAADLSPEMGGLLMYLYHMGIAKVPQGDSVAKKHDEPIAIGNEDVKDFGKNSRSP